MLTQPPKPRREPCAEHLVVVLLLSNLCEHLEALLDQVLLDDAQDLVLLQGLAGDVQRQILRIHHALHEVQPLGHELLAVVHDEDSSHVELDVVPLQQSLALGASNSWKDEGALSPSWGAQGHLTLTEIDSLKNYCCCSSSSWSRRGRREPGAAQTAARGTPADPPR